MGYNKFIRTDGTMLLDLTGDTVTENDLPKGVIAHNAFGDLIVGKGGGGICHNPHVYHLNDPDLLPDAVDGSLAVVSQTVSDTGTWLLNNELIQANLPLGNPTFLQFECNGVAYNSVEWGNYGPGSSTFGLSAYYTNENGESETKTFYIHNPSGAYGIQHGWVDEVYKTIMVSMAWQDGLTWLMSNGKKVAEGTNPPTTTLTSTLLYSRVNGSWVPEGDQDFAVITDCTGDHVNVVTKLPTEHIDSNALYLFNGDYYRYEDKAWKKYSSGGGESVPEWDGSYTITGGDE